tara:strand:- start:182 stop:340 length:159 start_codon:yes stop_codon:yes gene_type:complete
MKFKSVPFKQVSFGKKVVKFSKLGFYETDDKKEIEAIKKASGVEVTRVKLED